MTCHVQKNETENKSMPENKSRRDVWENKKKI